MDYDEMYQKMYDAYHETADQNGALIADVILSDQATKTEVVIKPKAEDNDTRLRILYLYQMLLTQTDEEHTLSTKQITDRMMEHHNILVHITGRVKSESEKGYYIVDTIKEAINAGVKIYFYYSELNGKKKVLRNDGKPYTVSPFDLIWDDNYYYLTGFCDERDAVRTYLVDRIKKQLELLAEKSVAKPKTYDVSKYTTEVFRMLSTDETIEVTLLCDNCVRSPL